MSSTYCAQLTRDLFAIAKFLFSFELPSDQLAKRVAKFESKVPFNSVLLYILSGIMCVNIMM